MNAAHTPGPWSVHPIKSSYCYIVPACQIERPIGGTTVTADDVNDYAQHIVAIDCATHRRTKSEARANARLIAATPDLLAYAKCEEARSCSEDVAKTVLKQHGWNPAKSTSHFFLDCMRRAAIAKATAGAA